MCSYYGSPVVICGVRDGGTFRLTLTFTEEYVWTLIRAGGGWGGGVGGGSNDVILMKGAVIRYPTDYPSSSSSQRCFTPIVGFFARFRERVFNSPLSVYADGSICLDIYKINGALSTKYCAILTSIQVVTVIKWLSVMS